MSEKITIIIHDDGRVEAHSDGIITQRTIGSLFSVCHSFAQKMAEQAARFVPGDKAEKVGKSEAIGLYLEARERIEKRMTAIAGCDDRAEFLVDKTILHNV